MSSSVRWEKLGHNPEFAVTYPACVDFLLDSGVAYLISGLHNSLITNPEKHVVCRDLDGHPLLLLEGAFVRWETIEQKFTYLKKYHVLCDKQNPQVRWTYTSHAGITCRDMYYFQEPFHVYELQLSAVAKLQNYAQSFFTDGSRNFATHVLQICTSKGVLCANQNAFLKSVGEKLASHYGVRVITPEGKVYSFGMRRDLGELEFVDASSALGKAKGRIAMNDYDELRPHTGRYVTSVAISKEAATSILDDILKTNGNTPSFDYFDENCVELATRCLKTAGVEVDTIERLEGAISDIILSVLKNIPIVGGVVRRVRQLVRAVFALFSALPIAIKQLCSFVVCIVLYLPTKMLAALKNLLVWKMGWTMQSPSHAALKAMRRIYLVDLFNEELSNIRYPRNLMRWQKRQVTTWCHQYEGRLSLALLPPYL